MYSVLFIIRYTTIIASPALTARRSKCGDWSERRTKTSSDRASEKERERTSSSLFGHRTRIGWRSGSLGGWWFCVGDGIKLTRGGTQTKHGKTQWTFIIMFSITCASSSSSSASKGWLHRYFPPRWLDKSDFHKRPPFRLTAASQSAAISSLMLSTQAMRLTIIHNM